MVGSTTTLDEHAGGRWLHRLEDVVYSKVLADRLLQPLFRRGQPHHVEHLTRSTAESFGGPDRFTPELGFDDLVNVHRGLGVTDEQRERFVALYPESLDEAGLPNATSVREAVRDVEFGARVAQQNSRASTDDELYPLDHVSLWEWEGDDQADGSS